MGPEVFRELLMLASAIAGALIFQAGFKIGLRQAQGLDEEERLQMQQAEEAARKAEKEAREKEALIQYLKRMQTRKELLKGLEPPLLSPIRPEEQREELKRSYGGERND